MLGPVGRHVHQALETEAARQTSVRRRVDQGRIEKGERQGLADRTFGAAFARRNRGDGDGGIGDETIEPRPRFAVSGRKSPLRLDAHGTNVHGPVALAQNDLAAPSGWRWDPCDARLKSPVVHARRGKEHVEWENAYDVGMRGLIGFSSDCYAIRACDALLSFHVIAIDHWFPFNFLRDVPYSGAYRLDRRVLDRLGAYPGARDIRGSGGQGTSRAGGSSNPSRPQ